MENRLQQAAPKTLRKNFTMSVETAHELEFLAKLTRKKQSQVIQELIHQETEVRRNEIRRAKLKKIKGAFTGLIGDKQSVQRMKSEQET